MGEGRQVWSGEAWAAAREAYLAGESAVQVCARFGFGLSALRARARREGWRRADRPGAPPGGEARGDLAGDLQEDLDEELAAAGAPDMDAMVHRAAAMAARAMALGRLEEAQGWTRLWERVFRMHKAGEVLDPRRSGPAYARPQTAPAPPAPAPPAPVAPAATRPADVHSVHSVHPENAVHIPNRAERRRLASLATSLAGRAQGP